MSEKIFTLDDEENGLCRCILVDGEEIATSEICELLNEQQDIIERQAELLKLIANACSYHKEHSVKEILRKEIQGIDTVARESANAWHDYVLLSNFFKEHYKEEWDNE